VEDPPGTPSVLRLERVFRLSESVGGDRGVAVAGAHVPVRVDAVGARGEDPEGFSVAVAVEERVFLRHGELVCQPVSHEILDGQGRGPK